MARASSERTARSISKGLDQWACWNHAQLDFSRPGKPTDNAVAEALNSRFRQECLNQHWFLSLEDAQQEVEGRRQEYNLHRPHSALDCRSPAESAENRMTAEAAVA